MISTRARLELKSGLAADAAPEIISALGFTIKTLFYIDAKGSVWQSKQPLATGQQIKLVSVAEAEFRKASLDAAQLSEGLTQRRIQAIGNGGLPHGSFFALATSAPAFTLETLPSIRWQPDHVIVYGPVAKP